MTVTFMWVGGAAWLGLFLVRLAKMNRAAIVALLIIAAVLTALYCWGLYRLHQQEAVPPGWQPGTYCQYHGCLPVLGPN